MSERINKETGCRYARFDGSIVNGDNPPRSKGLPSWVGASLWCLKHYDYESAHLIRLRNDERYAERCEQEALNAFPLEHKPLLSLSESAITKEVETEDHLEVMA